ncbi:MAG: hypothetical protein PHY39_05410 [Endomicrobiaceae bacterium]|nr:hypothetical protein [Endomicrobiaceae bacterium]
MLEITLGTNTSREKVLVPGTTVLRDLLESHNINYSTGSLHIDATPISLGDMDKTLTELGITKKAFIIAVVKADNA